MTPKFPAATRLRSSRCCLRRRPSSRSVSSHPGASAQTKRQQQYDNDGRPYYGPSGPNVSYQQGPRTRVYITKRSWLDAGTEVLPGDRKFRTMRFRRPSVTRSFARENINRPIDRQPLSPPSDLGGYPTRFPLY